MSTPDCNADFDTPPLPEFLQRGPKGLQPLREPQARPRIVAVEPPEAKPEPPPEPLAAVAAVIKATVAEMLRQRKEDRNRLNEIAAFMRSLTYGEMIELAEGFWKQKPEGEITQEMLPGMLHKWSNGRCGNT